MRKGFLSMKNSNNADKNPDQWVWSIDDSDVLSPSKEERLRGELEKFLEEHPDIKEKYELEEKR